MTKQEYLQYHILILISQLCISKDSYIFEISFIKAIGLRSFSTVLGTEFGIPDIENFRDFREGYGFKWFV